MTQAKTAAILKFPRTDTWPIMTGEIQLSEQHTEALLDELNRIVCTNRDGHTPPRQKHRDTTYYYDQMEFTYGEDRALEIFYETIIETYK
jgi:hypothetical protein